MNERRLIERWLPIGAIGEESVRERRALSALPAPYYLHVWWARRPLIASRAAVLASLLPESTTNDEFMSLLRIDGDPLSARAKIAQAKRTGVRVADPYGYARAFSCLPDIEKVEQAAVIKNARVLDPTAGGGSIPFESARLGFETIANDLNPVAATVLMSTVDYPLRFGTDLVGAFEAIAKEFSSRAKRKLSGIFDRPQDDDEIVTSFVWSRSTECPYCSGQIPLAPNWKLEKAVGMILRPQLGSGPGDVDRTCLFEVSHDIDLISEGTIAGTDIKCPFPDCARISPLRDLKILTKETPLGEVLTAVVVKRRVKQANKKIDRWERAYRAPRATDSAATAVESYLKERLEHWAVGGVLPTETLPEFNESWTHGNTPAQYGAKRFTDIFSSRQLAVHCTSVETFREILDEHESRGNLTELTRAAFVYLALAIDKLVDWNSKQCTWDLDKLRMAHTFQVHAFPIRWSYAEMDVLAPGLGYDWVIKQTSRCIKELAALTAQEGKGLFHLGPRLSPAKVTLGSGDHVDIEDGTIDAVVIDPPYGANVMYGELSDFFYVWLKRTAGLLLPGLFTRQLADKDFEAVANKARFADTKGAAQLATRHYRDRMQAIFTEAKRVLKADGIMTVMFTHKEAGAWDALTTGLVEAGFAITASWPINTEAESSTHIKNKAAANSTIFLVCRPRGSKLEGEVAYWEDVEPLVADAVRIRVEEFQKAGITGVDLYLASFGPALEEFSRHWPLKRGTPRPEPQAKKRRKQAELFEEEFDPYAVTPEDALDAARREVKTWRLNKLTHMKGRADLDPVTSWFVLAWDAFKAPVFSYDEGLRLARAVGADLEGMIGKICEKKSSDIKLWDSATRAAKSNLGSPDGSRSMLDAIHSVAYHGRTRSLEGALDMLKANGLESDPQFLAALEAVLEVLPPSKSFLGFDIATGDAKASSDDFEVLEKLRRLAFSDKVDEPEQLTFFTADRVAAE